MRDGTEIAADVVLPIGEGPFPTVMNRTPYGRWPDRSLCRRLVDAGYAYVAVDVRGRGDSDGEFSPHRSDSPDGYDCVEWAAAQPWSTGAIGMVGGSYEGLTQWWTVQARPPHLRCIVPLCVGAARPERWSFNTGIPYQYMAWWLFLVQGRTYQQGGPGWDRAFDHLPLRTLAMELGTSGSAWDSYVDQEWDYLDQGGALTQAEFEAIDIPVLIGVGWWDDQTTMEAWEALQAAQSAADCRLLVGPWDHGGNLGPRPVLGGLDVSSGVIDTIDYIEKFLSLHLKGEEFDTEANGRCRLFRTGEDLWDDRETWPDHSLESTSWWLDQSGRLGDLPPSAEGSDEWVFDPANPLRDMVDLDVFAWSDPPLDRRYLQRDQNTLVYSTDLLTEPMRVSGQVHLEVWVSSDRPDTDLFFELTDLHPDGRSITLGSEIGGHGLRLRYRAPGKDQPLGGRRDVVVANISGPYLHHTFLPGHRMQLAVRSTAWPFFARNLGGGGSWADETTPLVARNRIHRGPGFESRLIVPIEPDWRQA